MLLTIIEFAIVTIGAKLLLGGVVIYHLFPVDRRCPACDGETLPLRARAGLRWLGRLLGLQVRWCPRCGENSLARRSRSPGGTMDLVARRRVEKTS
jgi:hypothetical protein